MKKNMMTVAVFVAMFVLVAVAMAQNNTMGTGTTKGMYKGATAEEAKTLQSGWSIKKQILEKDVYNDNNEKVGEIEDVIVNQEKSLSYAIIGVGGYLGLAQHDVLIPINQLKLQNDRILLPGMTKDELKAMQEFEYKR